MRQLKAGIIGYGGFGQFLHRAWNELQEIRVIAIADPAPSKRPDERVMFYSDWKDLVKNVSVDIVSIVTPPASHADIACAAMESGKHVFIEKPIAVTLSDARRIIETRDRTGMRATIDYMMRFNPIVEALGSLSQEQIFGRLRRVDVENYAQDSSLGDDHWFWDPAISGGILIEHGVHFIDLVGSLTAAKPLKVTGFCSSHERKLDNQVMANVLYDDGLMVTHYHSFSRPGFFEDMSIRLSFDLAQIDVFGWMPLKGRIRALVNQDTLERMQSLPNLRVQWMDEITNIEDISRPAGWGEEGHVSAASENVGIRSGGIYYHADRMMEAVFGSGLSKAEVYATCVRSMLRDFICSIEHASRKPRVSLEDGLISLEIAAKATESGKEN